MKIIISQETQGNLRREAVSLLIIMHNMTTSDVSGILATIDNALAGDGDTMHWAPPAAAATFTWDEDAETGSAMFTSVSISSLESLQPGDHIWVNDLRYMITFKAEDAVQGFSFNLSLA